MEINLLINKYYIYLHIMIELYYIYIKLNKKTLNGF